VPGPDPWTSFLDWLSTIVVPDWNALINTLPLLVVLGIVGPIVTLQMLMVFWYMTHRRRGHLHYAEPDARPAELDAEGLPVFPPNVPYCEEHAVLYPPQVTACPIDGAELSVMCPVDNTVRVARQQKCGTCGTTYVLFATPPLFRRMLGAPAAKLDIRRTGRPPDGGAAVA
jgi:hypothetical protein